MKTLLPAHLPLRAVQALTARCSSHVPPPGTSFADHLRPHVGPGAFVPPPSPVSHAAAARAEPAEAFVSRVTSMAARLRVRPDDLLAVMRFESGLRPDAVNPATHAVGLIQFLPRTAADLLGLPAGMPGRDPRAVEAFAAMSADEQLDYVEVYLDRALGGRGSASLRDTYMAVLYPAAVGGGDGYAIGRVDGGSPLERAVYRQNAPLDANGDGVITAGEAASCVARMRG